MFEFYKNIEDKYYRVLHKIDKFFPATKISGAVDKIVPSFALLIALVVLVLGFGLLGFSGILGAQNSTINLTFLDSGKPFEGLTINTVFAGLEKNYTTNSEGQISLIVPLNSSVRVKAIKDGFEDLERVIEATEGKIAQSFTLQPKELQTKKTIALLYPNGNVFDKQAIVEFQCSNSGVAAPEKKETSTGLVEVTPSPNCGNLIVQVQAENFK
ncbi:MAG: hypothetical protein Q7K42_02570, partial [Candidatus Diapherotrites archaeon]|nr:hypothetical protein [Candidatus Diapherotrites archaeon]